LLGRGYYDIVGGVVECYSVTDLNYVASVYGLDEFETASMYFSIVVDVDDEVDVN
jgi:hypothetical protein